MYEDDVRGGRPNTAPEKLLRAMLLQVPYSIRPERQLMEQTQYKLLYRWLIGSSACRWTMPKVLPLMRRTIPEGCGGKNVPDDRTTAMAETVEIQR